MIFSAIHRQRTTLCRQVSANPLQLLPGQTTVSFWKDVPVNCGESRTSYLFWAPSWVDTQSTDFGEDRISQCSISETHRCVHLLQKWSPAWHRHQSWFVCQPSKLLSPTSSYLDHSAPHCKDKQLVRLGFYWHLNFTPQESSICRRYTYFCQPVLHTQEKRNTKRKGLSWWKTP